MDLRRAPARCSARPLHRSKLQVAVCSRGGASHGLFMMSPCRPARRQRTHNVVSGVRRPVELPYAPVPSCTAQPRARGSKRQLNPSSRARAVPVSHLRLAPYALSPIDAVQSMWSSRCRTAGRVRWKMTLIREIESLAARCQRATAHDMRIQSAVVTVVQVSGKVEVLPHGAWRCQLTCSSRCSSPLRVCWKMLLTRNV